MSDEVFSDVIRYVHSSQDLLTNMPFTLLPSECEGSAFREGMKLVGVAGRGQPQMGRRMEVLILTPLCLLLHH